MSTLGTLFAALVVLGGFTAQNVTIVYWTDASVSPFGILLLCGLFFGLFFGLLLVAYAIIYGDSAALAPSDDAAECRLFVWPFCRIPTGGAAAASVASPRPGDFSGSYGVLLSERAPADTAIYQEVRSSVRLTLAQILLLVGFLNGLNGFLIVYASPSSRTPPLVQAIIQNAGILFSVPFSLLALGDRKRYCSPAPVIAALLIAASVGVSLAPSLMGGGAGVNGGLSSIGWCIVYVLGVAASGAFNVVQQVFFVRSGMLIEGVPGRRQVRTMLRALFWSNVAQPLTYLVCFWVDLLPWFGTSTSVLGLARATVFSGACSVGGPALSTAAIAAVGSEGGEAPECETTTPYWAWAFLLAYAASYLGAARLNRESATFMMLTLVVVTMTTSAVWLIPGLNPNAATTPLWSVLTSLALSIGGTLLWKRWEGSVPADEQFGVHADAHAAAFEGGGAGSSGEGSGAGAAADDGDGDAPLRWGWAGGVRAGLGDGGGGGGGGGGAAKALDFRVGEMYDDMLLLEPPALVDVVYSGRQEIASLVNKYQQRQASLQARQGSAQASAAVAGAGAGDRGGQSASAGRVASLAAHFGGTAPPPSRRINS